MAFGVIAMDGGKVKVIIITLFLLNNIYTGFIRIIGLR